MSKTIALVITLASILSLFLYAGFDFKWWTPLNGTVDAARSLLLFIFHAIGALAFPLYELRGDAP